MFAACGKQTVQDLHLQGSVTYQNAPVSGKKFFAYWHFCTLCQNADLRPAGGIQQGKIDTIIKDYDNRKFYYVIIADDLKIPISPIITFNCDNKFKQDMVIQAQQIAINANVKGGDTIRYLSLLNLITPKGERLASGQNLLYDDSSYVAHASIKFDTVLTTSTTKIFTHVKEHSSFKVQYRKNNKDTTVYLDATEIDRLDLNL
jgi:hypothetical protein